MMARPLARTVCGAFKVACSLRRRSGVPLRFGSGTARRQFCVGVSQCNGDQSSSHAVEAPQDGLPLLGPEEEKESRGVGDSLVADSISQCCLMSLILKDCEQPIHVRGCEELENCANSTVLKSFYLIDVRKQWELYHGMIPGARHIPLNRLKSALDMSAAEFEREFEFDMPKNDDCIVFYCKTGERAERAALECLQAGYSNVKNYRGSFEEWFGWAYPKA